MTSQKLGVITCIPKGNKDRKLLKNWRPITLSYIKSFLDLLRRE